MLVSRLGERAVLGNRSTAYRAGKRWRSFPDEGEKAHSGEVGYN